MTIVWKLNMTGSDGPWVVHDWMTVEDDVRHACKETVRDCEQEINEGGHFASDEVREAMEDELGDLIFAEVIRQISREDRTAHIKVEPWYAVNQRCTWMLTVAEMTEEEAYRA